MKQSISVVIIALVAGSAACGARSVVAKRPTSKRVNADVTNMWAAEIQRVAQDGDWILLRSYAFVGDGIAAVTRGEDVSHSAVYDAKRGTIIEGVSPIVREVPLRKVLHTSRLAIVVRPNLSAKERKKALVRARSTVGAKYDWGGLVGLDDPDKFYCSELLFWAGRFEEKGHARPLVVSPAALINLGEVLYYSGPRDDDRIQHVARTRANKRRRVVRR